MDQELLKFAISQGLFAALFVWLLIDTRKESKNREESLNKTIEENNKKVMDLNTKRLGILLKIFLTTITVDASIIALVKLISIIN